MYGLIQFKGYNSKFKFSVGVPFRKYFISLPAFYLIIWHMKSPNNFKKQPFWKYDGWFSSEESKPTSVKYPWNHTFSGMTKIDFHQYCPTIFISLTKCSQYFLQRIFLSFFGTITWPKDIFCFHESIFQWQIKLISYRSEFWHLRRKPALLFSKWPFFQNSLIIPWATQSGKMQVKE